MTKRIEKIIEREREKEIYPHRRNVRCKKFCERLQIDNGNLVAGIRDKMDFTMLCLDSICYLMVDSFAAHFCNRLS